MHQTATCTKAAIKAFRADYVKRTVTITIETTLSDVTNSAASALAYWGENGSMLDIVFSRSRPPAPLLDMSMEEPQP
jgi:hypothetical protein